MKEKKKPCRLFKIAVACAAVLLMAGPVFAGQVISKIQDQSIAFRVYNGYTGDCTIVITGGGTSFVVTCDGYATALTNGLSYDTMTELDAGIVACTNRAGTSSLTVDADAALAADDVNGTLIDGTYTATANNWLEVLWDTSACKFYSLYLPSRDHYSGVSAYTLEKIQALPGGTGNVDVTIYKGTNLVAQKHITSPTYYATDGNTNAWTVDSDVNIDWEVNMPFSGTEAVIIRAARVTSAHTGVIGATLK